jgi:hypothetical protein
MIALSRTFLYGEAQQNYKNVAKKPTRSQDEGVSSARIYPGNTYRPEKQRRFSVISSRMVIKPFLRSVYDNT